MKNSKTLALAFGRLHLGMEKGRLDFQPPFSFQEEVAFGMYLNPTNFFLDGEGESRFGFFSRHSMKGIQCFQTLSN
jgi:hypothetical protein